MDFTILCNHAIIASTLAEMPLAPSIITTHLAIPYLQTSQLLPNHQPDGPHQCSPTLHTWYEAIRHLIMTELWQSPSWGLCCCTGHWWVSEELWWGDAQPDCPSDGLVPGSVAREGLGGIPLIGFKVIHWTMEQLEPERRTMGMKKGVW